MDSKDISNLLLERKSKSEFLIYDEIYSNYELNFVLPIAKVKFYNNWFGSPKFTINCIDTNKMILTIIEVNFGTWLLKDSNGKYGYVFFQKNSSKFEKFFYIAETFKPTKNLKNLYLESSSYFLQSKSSLSKEYLLYFNEVINSVKNFGLRNKSLFFAKLDKNLFGIAYQNNYCRLPKIALGICLAVYGYTKI